MYDTTERALYFSENGLPRKLFSLKNDFTASESALASFIISFVTMISYSRHSTVASKGVSKLSTKSA